ncbi:uncharacterized protein RHO17_020643 isoform 1-T2 [Thomomys bottae]
MSGRSAPRPPRLDLWERLVGRLAGARAPGFLRTGARCRGAARAVCVRRVCSVSPRHAVSAVLSVSRRRARQPEVAALTCRERDPEETPREAGSAQANMNDHNREKEKSGRLETQTPWLWEDRGPYSAV